MPDIAIRRLLPRGAPGHGAVVDADGAVLGVGCVLVTRVAHRFHSIGREEAGSVQATWLAPGLDRDWLFEQSSRIATALSRGELALAQIYGLRIPVIDEGDQPRTPSRDLTKANFNPDEPRIPKGEPGAGQWTYGGESYAQPSSGSGQGGNEPPPAAGGDPKVPPVKPTADTPGPDKPGMEYRVHIPTEAPPTVRERNHVVRRIAEWLRRATAGAGRYPEPRIRAVLLAIRVAAWLIEYYPEIRSYLDAPKNLEELHQNVDHPKSGYQVHHIVEAQYGSADPNSNARRFGDRLEGRDNLVLVPKWRHVEISGWYSTSNPTYSGTTPRSYLRGSSWDEQYRIGLQALRSFGVLK